MAVRWLIGGGILGLLSFGRIGSVRAEVVRGKIRWGSGKFWSVLLLHARTAVRSLWVFGRWSGS